MISVLNALVEFQHKRYRRLPLARFPMSSVGFQCVSDANFGIRAGFRRAPVSDAQFLSRVGILVPT